MIFIYEPGIFRYSDRIFKYPFLYFIIWRPLDIIFVYFRYIPSNRTLDIKKENILKINPNLVDVNSKEWIDEDYPIQSDVHFNQNFGNIDAIRILDSLDKRTKDEALENFKLDKKYINRSFINDNFYLNVLFDSEIETYKNELYNEIVSIENKLNFLNY